MGTVTITASGFSNLGSSAPANWPPGVTFPATGNPNGTKTYTINDADWLSLLTWTASSQFNSGNAPTAQQILLAWLQIWINGTKNAVSQYNTTPAVTPAPISIS